MLVLRVCVCVEGEWVGLLVGLVARSLKGGFAKGKVKRYKSKYGCQHPNPTRKVTR